MATATSPTLLLDLVRDVRVNLLEAQPRFWSDDEINKHLYNGCKAIWKSLIDLHKGHFQTIDITNVSQAANTSTLTGLPADVFRITLIEPRNTVSGASGADITYRPKPYISAEFCDARAQSAGDLTSSLTVLYDILQEGPPVNTMTVQVAPQLTAALLLRLVYIRALPVLTPDLNNPIPGESDAALVAYATAFAKAKLPNVGSPDPGWLEIFKAEREILLQASTPRQEQEGDAVGAVFESDW